MDVYACSTQRHLMFSILRAIKTNNESKIIMILDQQGLAEDSYDVSVLPDFIEVIFINRKNVFKKVYAGLVGFMHKLSAVTLISNRYFSARTRHVLFENEFGWFVDKNTNLYLFNDRNRFSRLLRLAFDSYDIIEDGLGNYYGFKASLWDKLRHFKRKKRYMGEDIRCKYIYLTCVNNVNHIIINKVRLIDFIRPQAVSSILFPFFKFYNKQLKFKAIIATQPIAVSSLSDSGCDLLVYKKLCTELESKNISYAMKVHPRENQARYSSGFDNVNFLDGKLPLELFLISQKEKIDIYSIYSTAGKGFEKFCNIKTLIESDESNHQEEIFNCWKEDNKLIDSRIRSVLLSNYGCSHE